jgi:hypothetical protein
MSRTWTYEEILAACAAGEYPSCEIRAASGRLNRLLGLTRADLAWVEGLARERGAGLVLLGSRISGPRARQRGLHPALAAALPLKTDYRAASALDPGAQGVEIDKTMIKEHGRADPRTSDLSVLVVDGARAPEEVAALARELETALNARGWTFPVRVFDGLGGRRFRGEDDFLEIGEEYLRSQAPGAPFSSAQWREGLSEIYLPVNLPRRAFLPADWKNGALSAVLASATFSAGLGFHWILPPVGFAFGLFGRRLGRLRAWTARAFGDGVAANAAALALDAAIGLAAMGLVIVPVAGYPVTWARLLAGSAAHTLAKGSLRLWLDKRYASGAHGAQARGAAWVIALNFVQGCVTSFAYAGHRWAWAVQAAACAGGAWLVFGPALRRSAQYFSRWSANSLPPSVTERA